MQLPLFKALQSIKIDDDKATTVVVALEEHSAMKIAEATAPLIAEIKGVRLQVEAQGRIMEAQGRAVEAQLGSLRWMVGVIGSIIAVSSLAPALFHLFK